MRQFVNGLIELPNHSVILTKSLFSIRDGDSPLEWSLGIVCTLRGCEREVASFASVVKKLHATTLAKIISSVMDRYFGRVESLMQALILAFEAQNGFVEDDGYRKPFPTVREIWTSLLNSTEAEIPQRCFADCAKRTQGTRVLNALLGDEYVKSVGNEQLRNLAIIFCERVNVQFPNPNGVSLAILLAFENGHPEMTDFLRSEARAFTYKNFSSVHNARHFAERLRGNGDVALKPLAGGKGKSSYLEIRKIHKLELDHKRAQSRVPEVKRFLCHPPPTNTQTRDTRPGLASIRLLLIASLIAISIHLLRPIGLAINRN